MDLQESTSKSMEMGGFAERVKVCAWDWKGSFCFRPFKKLFYKNGLSIKIIFSQSLSINFKTGFKLSFMFFFYFYFFFNNLISKSSQAFMLGICSLVVSCVLSLKLRFLQSLVLSLASWLVLPFELNNLQQKYNILYSNLLITLAIFYHISPHLVILKYNMP